MSTEDQDFTRNGPQQAALDKPIGNVLKSILAQPEQHGKAPRHSEGFYVRPNFNIFLRLTSTCLPAVQL